MKIIYPLYLEFQLNPQKHTVSAMERMKDKRLDIRYNVKAIIGTDFDAMMKTLKQSIVDVYSNFFWGGIGPEDFELFYSECEITDGRVWIGGSVGSYTKLVD